MANLPLTDGLRLTKTKRLKIARNWLILMKNESLHIFKTAQQKNLIFLSKQKEEEEEEEEEEPAESIEPNFI